jgi:hypothetical protein
MSVKVAFAPAPSDSESTATEANEGDFLKVRLEYATTGLRCSRDA